MISCHFSFEALGNPATDVSAEKDVGWAIGLAERSFTRLGRSFRSTACRNILHYVDEAIRAWTAARCSAIRFWVAAIS